MWACEKGNYEIVKLLIQQNANVNVRSKVSSARLTSDVFKLSSDTSEWLDSSAYCMFQKICEDY